MKFLTKLTMGLALGLSIFTHLNATEKENTMTLSKQLVEKREGFLKMISTEKEDTLNRGVEELIKSHIIDKTPKIGDKIANFQLPSATGKSIALDELLKKGKVIIAFYRGSWCPYCSLELVALQKVLPQIKEAGATLVAISPETPDNAWTTEEKLNLKFEVLSDLDNNYAKELNLVFKVDQETLKLYSEFGIDIAKHNGNDKNEIPIPATYVIDTDGTVIYAFANEDYTKRAEPADIIKFLK